jgi:hypothetical protein
VSAAAAAVVLLPALLLFAELSVEEVCGACTWLDACKQ